MHTHDLKLLNEHSAVAVNVVKDVNKAIEMGLVPEKYQNAKDLFNIMNVVLQGVNNDPSNAEIYTIGMNIYNTVSAPAPSPMIILRTETIDADNTTQVINTPNPDLLPPTEPKKE